MKILGLSISGNSTDYSSDNLFFIAKLYTLMAKMSLRIRN
jgi:hypothetical protein